MGTQVVVVVVVVVVLVVVVRCVSKTDPCDIFFQITPRNLINFAADNPHEIVSL